MTPFRDTLRALLANRRSPEARALFVTLSRYVEGRVRYFGRGRGADLFSDAELDEVVGEVMLQLVSGSLAQFRGESLPEMLGFVRTVTDRCLWRGARRRIEERRGLEADGLEIIESWTSAPRRADDGVLLTDVPITEIDQTYLLELMRVGSKAEFARRTGVSRAAVTKRVDRIQARIAAMPSGDRLAAEAWLSHAARQVVAGD